MRLMTAAGGVRLTFRTACLCAAWIACIHLFAAPGPAQERQRTRSGLVAFYDFRPAGTEIVPDRSGLGDDADLRFGEGEALRWDDGSLTLVEPAKLRSRSRPAQISDLVRVSGELTVETWIEPAADLGPEAACIVAMSNGSSQHNFALVQEGGRFRARFRTGLTGREDPPQLATPDGSAEPALAHLVFTRDRTGRSRLYLDGEVVAERVIAGSVADWEKTTLALGNGPRSKQPWLGTFRMVAVYGRELHAGEVEGNFRAGADPARAEHGPSSASRDLFESRIAGLIAGRCLDCHDAAVRQGGLDLSSRETAMAGGDHGNAIVPGAPSESLVWQMIQSDAMPQNRQPLAEADKEALHDWIEGGAHWPDGPLERAAHGPGGGGPVSWVRRLTVPEYAATVRSATGVEIAADAARLLPPDLRADGFDNTAYNLTVDLGHVEAYARLAETVADRIEIPPAASGTGLMADGRMHEMGERILRGPLSGVEIDLYQSLADSVMAAGGTHEDSVRRVVEAMLQSPRFLYRVEQQVGDGSRWPIDDHELAARLSYIVWGEPPDAILSAAADEGILQRSEELRSQVRRMLTDPRAVARSVAFLEQWLDLGRLETLQPDREHFPHWSPDLAGDMRAETVGFFKDLVWNEKRPLADLLSAQFSHLTPALAAYYGLPARGQGLRRYELAAVPSRGGILTQAAVLTKGGAEASMVTRGLFVLQDLLFGEVGSPPPGLDTTPVPASPGRSRRAIATERVESPACGGCHSRFEPLAFALERFDGLGRYREIDEHGNALREDGEILFPGSSEPVRYATAAEMMELLAASDRVRMSITRKVAQFAIGRPLVASDQGAIEAIHRRSEAAGGTYQGLIEAIVTSDIVRTTRTELPVSGYD